MTSARLRSMAFALLAILAVLPGLATAQQGHAPIQATPTASPVAATPIEWTVDNVRVVEVDGSAISMSPDGARIAGIGPEFALCIWDVATMEPTCDQGERVSIAPESVVWSPDSTAIAFTEESSFESDIHIHELGSGTSIRLTDDGLDGRWWDMADEPIIPLDRMPAWSLDSQSVFFTRTNVALGQPPTDLLRVSRNGGEAELLETISTSPYAVYTPMHVLSDGSLLYTHAAPNLSNPDSGIWLRTPDGESHHLLPGGNDDDYPAPVITDVHERDGTIRIAAYSAVNMGRMDPDLPLSFTFDLESREVTPVEASEPGLLPWAITFAPDGETFWSGAIGQSTASLLQVSGGDQQLIDLADGDARPPGLYDPFPSMEWRGENTLFVPGGITRGSYILTMTSGTAETPATPCGCTPPPAPGT